MKFDKDLVAASTTPLILTILSDPDARDGSYGYAIIKEVCARSENEMHWTEGMLYPVLHRLERQRFIESFWKTSEETGRRRKYYRITSRGDDELHRLMSQWRFVDRILRSSWDHEISYARLRVIGG
jgi:PadR family transcriptional regulator, regulatory protein PadR